MIQRIQSLYLLLAAAAAAAALSFNLWKATLTNNSVTYVNASSNYLLFVLYVVVILLSVVSIFLFKKRKLQFRLTVFGILFGLGAMGYQYYVVQQTANRLSSGTSIATASYLPASFLPIVVIILLFLAARGIYKDEKLIKSLDRLR